MYFINNQDLPCQPKTTQRLMPGRENRQQRLVKRTNPNFSQERLFTAICQPGTANRLYGFFIMIIFS